MSVEAATTVNNSNNNGKRKHAKVDNEIDPKQVHCETLTRYILSNLVSVLIYSINISRH